MKSNSTEGFLSIPPSAGSTVSSIRDFQLQLELFWLSFLEFGRFFLQLKFFLSLLFFWRRLFYRPYEVIHKSLVIKSEFILHFKPLGFWIQRELSRNKRSSWRLKMNQWSLLQWYKTIVAPLDPRSLQESCTGKKSFMIYCEMFGTGFFWSKFFLLFATPPCTEKVKNKDKEEDVMETWLKGKETIRAKQGHNRLVNHKLPHGHLRPTGMIRLRIWKMVPVIHLKHTIHRR